MERYIGLDVHAKSSTYAVISENGKRLHSGVVETHGRALIEVLKMVPGRKHVCLEEGAQSEWLYEVLSPHAAEVVVTHLEQPPMAKLTLARKIAATVLAMWKSQEVYDPEKHRNPG